MTEETTNTELLTEIEALNIRISKIQDKIGKLDSSYESKEVAKLFEALAKAQLEMYVAKTDSTNPFFKSKYADLASVVGASRPCLAKNGLSVIQRVLPNGNQALYLHTRLCHSSGQWMESRMPLNPPKQDIQTMGSYMTYLRRYNYASVVGVVASEEDDDGETAMHEPRKRGQSPNKGTDVITRAQLQVVSQELDGFEEVLESLLKGFSIAKLADLPSKHYTKCLERIRDIKRAKES